MVYNEIGLYYGCKVNLDEFVQFSRFIGNFLGNKSVLLMCDSITESPDLDYDLLEKINSLIARFRGMTVCTPPCCSTVNGKEFVIGVNVANIRRVHTRCDKCEEYTLCDTCIGNTSNGNYDVCAMQESILEAKNVCPWCFYDRMPESDCPHCHFKSYSQSTVNTEKYTTIDLRIATFFEKRTLGFYYVLDDCLSCT